MNERIKSLLLSVLKLGFTAFGGPAVAIALMRQEFVLKRRWLSEDEFLDFMGISAVIPGPNAMELIVHIGFKHAGWLGMILAGLCYIIPAMLIVMVIAWAYLRFGSLPSLDGVLYGIKPVVIAILISAFVGMIKPRIKQSLGILISLAAFIAHILGIGPVVILLGGGVIYFIIKSIRDYTSHNMPLAALLSAPLPFFQVPQNPIPFSNSHLFFVFLKAGAFMYGSGYVLLAFIEEDLVSRLGWLTSQQLLDAIAVGQVTPGPLATTATFVGYILGGIPAGLLATLAMFLPGFIFVAVTFPIFSVLRTSKQLHGLLDGVNFAALGLMAGVTWDIG
ncbi:MAG: chromate efflux transporter, partial [Anaerolineales bacterium]